MKKYKLKEPEDYYIFQWTGDENEAEDILTGERFKFKADGSLEVTNIDDDSVCRCSKGQYLVLKKYDDADLYYAVFVVENLDNFIFVDTTRV